CRLSSWWVTDISENVGALLEKCDYLMNRKVQILTVLLCVCVSQLNHFPGTFQIGRKDRLWRNLSKMQVRFGKQEFSFFPQTFVLPQDIKLLRKPASARGIGIQVIHKWSQMPRKRPLLVQKYLDKPYLISGNKFDLRLYVYVTSYNPLRVYMFSDGLVRFASCK
uniref:Tubulin tyrosine ligase-like family, member 4 n=1 Tax=Neolamprologus brichardi TaxID=32507 RepID=A0A3Q4MWM9_NEOBR